MELEDRLTSAVEVSFRNGVMIAKGYNQDIHFKIKTRVLLLDYDIVDKITLAIHSTLKNETADTKEVREAISELLKKEKTKKKFQMKLLKKWKLTCLLITM